MQADRLGDREAVLEAGRDERVSADDVGFEDVVEIVDVLGIEHVARPVRVALGEEPVVLTDRDVAVVGRVVLHDGSDRVEQAPLPGHTGALQDRAARPDGALAIAS